MCLSSFPAGTPKLPLLPLRHVECLSSHYHICDDLPADDGMPQAIFKSRVQGQFHRRLRCYMETRQYRQGALVGPRREHMNARPESILRALLSNLVRNPGSHGGGRYRRLQPKQIHYDLSFERAQEPIIVTYQISASSPRTRPEGTLTGR
jgi:hypothetical protein